MPDKSHLNLIPDKFLPSIKVTVTKLERIPITKKQWNDI